MTGRCAHTNTPTHIERTHYLRHSLRSLGGDKNWGLIAIPIQCCILSACNLQLLFLQLHEMDVDVTNKLANCDTFCDVICLLYDVTNPHTFEYCAQLYTVLSLYNQLC